MKKLIIILSLLSCFQLKAQTKYWRGGTGDWSNSTLWSLTLGGGSCFCVPTVSDNVHINPMSGGADEIVTIPNGYVAQAKSVNMFANTTLIVGTTGAGGTAQLLVEDPLLEGVDVWGKLEVRGILAIKDAPEEGIIVRAPGELDLKAGGLIDIRTNDAATGHGIRNLGYIVTRRNMVKGPGTINIYDISGNGIYADATSIIDHNGSLLIEKTNTQNDDGIFNTVGAVFTNKVNGKIVIRNINNLQSEGIDNRHTFLNDGEITIIDVESSAGISSALHATAIFTNNGMININQMGSHGLWVHSDGQLNNSGTIDIDNIFGNNHHGIFNQARVDNQTGGSINITDINGNGSRAVYNKKVFSNDGLIDIRDVDNNNGIRNETPEALLSNEGTIQVRETDFAGILNIDGGKIFNSSKGTIDLSLIDEAAIRNKDNSSVTSWGMIKIDSSSGISSHGVHNQDGSTFTNQLGAELHIDHINGLDSRGIENSVSVFNNEGLIMITSVASGEGLKNIIAFFENKGSFVTSDAQGGILTTGTGCVVKNTGIIQIANSISAVNTGVKNLSFSKVTNEGQISISPADAYGVVNEAIFENKGGSMLTIASCRERGILNQNSAVMTNDGSITINVIQSTPNIRGIQNASMFLNNDYLMVTNAMGTGGLAISNNDVFVNGESAQIEVDLCTKGLKNDKSFENLGQIDISNTTGDGLTNLTSVALFTNGSGGEINITNGIGGDAIRNSGSAKLNNGSCATFTVSKKLRNLTSTFDNDGFLYQDFSGTNINTGSFKNDGVIEDRQGSFEGILSSIDNHGVIAGPLHGYHVTGIGSQGVLLGSQTDITTGLFYYAESNLTNQVGTYAPYDNEWIPAAAGVDAIYLELTNTCETKVVRQNLDHAILVGCEEIPQNLVVASSNGNWHNPFIWNTSQVPTACLEVFISDPVDVTINSGQRGSAQLIEVEVGANLVINGQINILGK